jgi:Mor family transcriptional regulator
MRVGRLEAALIELLGDAATGRLIELHSGEVLYIPRHVSRRHPVAQEIGLDAARRLVAVYGGESLPIPTGHRRRLDARNRAIVEARRAGATVENLRRAHGLSRRTIYTIVAAAKGEEHSP